VKNHGAFVFQTFGFWAGVRYLWDTTALKIRRALGREPLPLRFEDLTDDQAEKVAWAFGIFRWDSRKHLNQIWSHFEKTLN